jgi:hypothetical protein
MLSVTADDVAEPDIECVCELPLPALFVLPQLEALQPPSVKPPLAEGLVQIGIVCACDGICAVVKVVAPADKPLVVIVGV